MACLIVSCVYGLLFIFPSIVQVTPSEYYWSHGGAGTSDAYVEVVPLRARRYVSSPISRLADSYSNALAPAHAKGDVKHRAEFYGNLAVAGVEETGGSGQPLAHAMMPSTQTAPETSSQPPPVNVTKETNEATLGTSGAPEKVTKKPVDKLTKKPTEQEKSSPIDKTSNSTKEDADDMDTYPKEITNSTLAKHNITQKQLDYHTYYTSEYMVGESVARRFWIDLENEKGVTVNEMLSKSHRRAATVRLSFDFPFYGHTVRNMTVATGGFLYTGDYIHSWLAATQYIAPLMANFDTSMSNDSFVKYRDNGTSFTVEWASVSLQDKKEAGQFTFQTTLYKNGDILFVYKDVPILVEDITDTQHPVKVGLSDAYIIDKTVFYIRKKTIYEYHRVTFNRDEIKNWTVIYMKALPTCVNLNDCHSCLNHNTNFSCKWCQKIRRCSSGFDRFLQEWSSHQCHITAISDSNECTDEPTISLPSSVEAHSKPDEPRERVGHSGMLGLFLVVCILSCLGLSVFHAYRNPHTRFGQMLIKYRPSQWSLRRGEARYTAATIHM